MCLGFDISHFKFRYSNGYVDMSVHDENLFNKKYESARENDSVFTNRTCGFYLL